MDRYTKVARGVMDWRCYQEMLEEKNFASFQPSLQQYFKEIARPTSDPVFSTLVASLDSPAPPTPPPNKPVSYVPTYDEIRFTTRRRNGSPS